MLSRLRRHNSPHVRPHSLLSVMLCVMAACSDNVKWNASYEVDPDGWSSMNPVCFDIDPGAYVPRDNNRFARLTAVATGDTIARLHGNFRGELALRYNSHCNVSDLRLVVEKSSLDGDIHTDTLTYHLFNADGSPAGTGRFGIYEVSRPLPGILKVADGTVLSIAPIPYAVPPQGITALTLLLK